VTVKKKGITLVELIIAMAILSIVLSVISSFFFVNYKALNSVNKDLELQSQGEKAINFMVDNIIEGYGVKTVETPLINLISNNETEVDENLKLNSETEIKKLSVAKQDGKEVKYTSVFELDNGVLNYDKGTDGSVNGEICNGIKSIIITPLPLGKSFSSGNGLLIKITMKSDKLEKVFVNEVYMRNKEVN
jgi:prepilin-type N-terminal cleavage/methylation domain-containing protein